MSIEVTTVRQALVAVLGKIHNAVRTYELIPATPQVPCLLVYPPESIDYMIMRDTDRGVFPVLVLVGPADPTAQEVLEGFMSGAGPLSIRQALYADRTLGRVVSNTKLLDMTSGAYSLNVNASDTVIGAEFRVEITG